MFNSKDYVYLGSTPIEEECQQVGSNFNPVKETLELKAYKAQMERLFPDMPQGLRFCLKREQHDFGSYRELVLEYDTESEKQTDFAFDVEGKCPDNWDEEAMQFLKDNGYFDDAIKTQEDGLLIKN